MSRIIPSRRVLSEEEQDMLLRLEEIDDVNRLAKKLQGMLVVDDDYLDYLDAVGNDEVYETIPYLLRGIKHHLIRIADAAEKAVERAWPDPTKP